MLYMMFLLKECCLFFILLSPQSFDCMMLCLDGEKLHELHIVMLNYFVQPQLLYDRPIPTAMTKHAILSRNFLDRR